MMQKQDNKPEETGVVQPKIPEEMVRERTVESIEDQSLNEGLKNLISDYWEGRQSPGFRGYQAKVSEKNGKKKNIKEKEHLGKAKEPVPKNPEEPEQNLTAGLENAEKKDFTDIKNAEKHDSAGIKSSEKNDSAGAEDSEKNLVSEAEKSRQDKRKASVEEEQITVFPKGNKTGSKHKKAKKKNIPLRIAGGLVAVLAIFVVVVAIVFFTMEHNGRKQLANTVIDEEITSVEDAALENGGKTVVYNGATYQYNEDISTILCMGVDREEYNESGTYGEGGQADAIFLVVMNNTTGQTTMIPISRNTMVEIDEYKEDGSYWRQNEIQIALAYTYGDGKEESCKNVAKAVSRLMYGMPINGYAAIDLSVIGPLNDAVGGVEVTVLEDLPNGLTAGETVTLQGEQAVTYVRSRKSEGYDLEVDNNAARMERQQQYMGAFLKTMINQTKKNPTLPLTLYKTASDGMITSVTASEVTYFASLLVQHGLDNSIISIPGTAQKGEYTEVYVDNDALYQIILDTFYVKTN